jgi:hypothetical protein
MTVFHKSDAVSGAGGRHQVTGTQFTYYIYARYAIQTLALPRVRQVPPGRSAVRQQGQSTL